MRAGQAPPLRACRNRIVGDGLVPSRASDLPEPRRDHHAGGDKPRPYDRPPPDPQGTGLSRPRFGSPQPRGDHPCGRGQAPPLRPAATGPVGDGLVPSRASGRHNRVETTVRAGTSPAPTTGRHPTRRGRACPVPRFGSPQPRRDHPCGRGQAPPLRPVATRPAGDGLVPSRASGRQNRVETTMRAGTSPAPTTGRHPTRRGRACPVPRFGSPQPRGDYRAGGAGNAALKHHKQGHGRKGYARWKLLDCLGKIDLEHRAACCPDRARRRHE